MKWPNYPYAAVRSNPFSIMSLEAGRLFFVTCDATREGIERSASWLVSLNDGTTSLCLYENGKPHRRLTC